jgi:hypothetical protein
MKTNYDSLVDYLIKYNFKITDSEELQKKISGMTAKEIISAMEDAEVIKRNLCSTSLGKELN